MRPLGTLETRLDFHLVHEFGLRHQFARHLLKLELLFQQRWHFVRVIFSCLLKLLDVAGRSQFFIMCLLARFSLGDRDVEVRCL